MELFGRRLTPQRWSEVSVNNLTKLDMSLDLCPGHVDDNQNENDTLQCQNEELSPVLHPTLGHFCCTVAQRLMRLPSMPFVLF